MSITKNGTWGNMSTRHEHKRQYAADKTTDLNILALLIRDHNFGNKMLYVRWNRLLADGLNQFAELHSQSLLALAMFGVSKH
jgi:hypothetical protein